MKFQLLVVPSRVSLCISVYLSVLSMTILYELGQFNSLTKLSSSAPVWFGPARPQIIVTLFLGAAGENI